MRAAAKAKVAGAGAIGSAIAASVCCFGPLVLAVLGLGGGALLVRFAPYRPYFLAATGLLLAAAFVLTYRGRVAESCEPGSLCAAPSGRNRQRLMLWIVTAIVLLLSAFPYYSGMLF